MSKILQRQVVVVHRQVNSSEQTFTFNLGLRFTPTSVILRTLVYGKNGGTPDNYVNGVIFPWTNGEVACCFTDAGNSPIFSNPGTIFKLTDPGKLTNGDVRFTVRRLTDTQDAHSIDDGIISLTFEFIKEDLEEPDNLLNEMRSLIEVLKIPKNDVFPFNPLPAQKGNGDCMCGGELTGDTRNALDQINPIPDVNSTTMNVPISPEEDKEEGKQEKKQEEGDN